MPIIPAGTTYGQKWVWEGTNDHWISIGNYINLSSNAISQTASYASTGGVMWANVYMAGWSSAVNGSDGLSISEAIYHYNYGKRQEVDVPLRTVNLSKVSLSDFDGKKFLKVDLGGSYFSSVNDMLVHGTIILEHVSDNIVKIKKGSETMFDFDIKPWRKYAVRNIKTIALFMNCWTPATIFTGSGAFNINYTGYAVIKY